MRSISARAYIDFPVNKTQIFPSYRRNPSELAKIRATIDSVRNDENLSITNIHIKDMPRPKVVMPTMRDSPRVVQPLSPTMCAVSTISMRRS